MMCIINPRVANKSSRLVEAYRAIAPASIGHHVKQGFMDVGIRPVYRKVKMVGTAFTVRMPANNNSINRKVLELVGPNDVIVIERTGDKHHACWGEMTSLQARMKGASGVIVDGAITDIIETEEMGFPAFSRTISAVLGQRLDMSGEINTPIVCGGVAVNPGDLIVADDNGIIVMTPEVAEGALLASQKAEAEEGPIRDWILNGGFIADYKSKS